MLERTRPQRADLSGANLRGENLSGASLSGADFSGADLREANLQGASLFDATLSGANLSGANLSNAYLSGVNLSDAYLSGANLSDAELNGADLRGVDLSDADLSGANLGGANLNGAILIGANLIGANLRDADLSGADLSGADLRCASLRETIIDLDNKPLALLHAIWNGNSTQVEALRADPLVEPTAYNNAAIWAALSTDQWELARALLADSRVTISDKNIALLLAVSGGVSDAVEALLADAEVQDYAKELAIRLAAGNRDLDIFHLLARAVDHRVAEYAAMSAISDQPPELVWAFLKMRLNDSSRLLEAAAMGGHLAALELILSTHDNPAASIAAVIGASPPGTRDALQSYLDNGSVRHRIDCARELFESGARISAEVTLALMNGEFARGITPGQLRGLKANGQLAFFIEEVFLNRSTTSGEVDDRGADFSDADLSGVDLRGANFSDADLRGANLCDADLRGVDLSDADLNGASLNRAILSGANLSGANLFCADLSDANLFGADLNGANLQFAQLADTIIDPNNTSLAFLHAISNRDSTQIEMLRLDPQADPTAYDNAAIWEALSTDQFELARAVLADLRVTASDKNIALVQAVRRGDADAVKALLADSEVQDQARELAIRLAADNRDLDMFRLLARAVPPRIAEEAATIAIADQPPELVWAFLKMRLTGSWSLFDAAAMGGHLVAMELILSTRRHPGVSVNVERAFPVATRDFLQAYRENASVRHRIDCAYEIFESRARISAEAMLALAAGACARGITPAQLRTLHANGKLAPLIEGAFGRHSATSREVHEALVPWACTAKQLQIAGIPTDIDALPRMLANITDLPDWAALKAWELWRESRAQKWLAAMTDHVLGKIGVAIDASLAAERAAQWGRMPLDEAVNGFEMSTKILLERATLQVQALYHEAKGYESSARVRAASDLRSALDELDVARSMADVSKIASAQARAKTAFDSYEKVLKRDVGGEQPDVDCVRPEQVAPFAALREILGAPAEALMPDLERVVPQVQALHEKVRDLENGTDSFSRSMHVVAQKLRAALEAFQPALNTSNAETILAAQKTARALEKFKLCLVKNGVTRANQTLGFAGVETAIRATLGHHNELAQSKAARARDFVLSK